MSNNIALSKNLEKSLKKARSRYLLVFYGEIFAKLIIVLLSSYFLFYILDRLFTPPFFVRIILNVLTWFFVVNIIISLIKVNAIFKKNYLPIIKVLQNHFTELGDSLQSAIELASGKDRPSNISEKLCRAAIDQVDKKVSQYKLILGINYANFIRFFIVVIFIISCLVGLLKFESEAFLITFKRWINPISKIERYLFTQIDLQVKNLIVVKGEVSFFNLKVSKDSYFKPKYFNYKVLSIWEKESFLYSKKNEQYYKNLAIPALIEAVTLKIKKGDFYQKIKLIPKDRPQLLDMKIEFKYPKYLGLGLERKKLYGKIIKILPDTKVKILGKLNKDIKNITLQINDGNLKKIKFHQNFFNTDFSQFNEGDKLKFYWLDKDNLGSGEKYIYEVVFYEDALPRVVCEGIGRQKIILSKDVLDIKISATDDFAIKEIGYEWIVKDKEENELKKYSEKLKQGTQKTKRLSSQIIFSPDLEGIPEESNVFIRAYALDFQPYSEKIYSQEYKIYVLSLEEHFEIIEEKFQKILQRLKSLVQSEQNNIQKTEAIEIYTNEKIILPKVDQEILSISRFENDIYLTLKALISQGYEAIQEALQNELFRNEVFIFWKKALKFLDKLAMGPVTEAQKLLREAAKKKKVEERRNYLFDGKEQQEKVLRTLEDFTGKYADINRDSAINTFAIRFQKNSKKEAKIAEDLKKIFLNTAGIPVHLLSEKFRKIHNTIIEEQKSINIDLKSLEQEIFTLFNQTKIEIYKNVYEQIIITDVNNYLEVLLSDISKNKTRFSIDPAKKWSAKFLVWANLLNPKEEKSNDKEEDGEEAEKNNFEEEAENDLLVIIERLAEEEEKIYKITKNLMKWNRNQRYKKKLKLIQNRQERNAKKTIEVSESKGIKPKLKESLENINLLMSKAYEKLVKEGAGQKALNFESSAFNLLLALIREEEGKGKSGEKSGKKDSKANSSGSSSGAAEGENDGGGSGKGEVVEESGDLKGGEKFGTISKSILKGNSSIDIINASPVEYQNALEKYYKQLEKSRK